MFGRRDERIGLYWFLNWLKSVRPPLQLYVGVIKCSRGLKFHGLWSNQTCVISHIFSLQLVAYTFVPFPNPNLQNFPKLALTSVVKVPWNSYIDNKKWHFTILEPKKSSVSQNSRSSSSWPTSSSSSCPDLAHYSIARVFSFSLCGK